MNLGQLETVLSRVHERDGDMPFVIGCPDGTWAAAVAPTLSISADGAEAVVFPASVGLHATVSGVLRILEAAAFSRAAAVTVFVEGAIHEASSVAVEASESGRCCAVLQSADDARASPPTA